MNNKLRAELMFRYVMEQNRISQEFGETASPAFFLSDFAIAYTVYKDINLRVGVNNMFDETYYEHLSRSVKGTDPRPIYATGRSYFVSFNLNF